jgi:hypothetical protein
MLQNLDPLICSPCQTAFYAPSNTPIWALYNKALSTFISEQVQQIKLQFLVKEYSPLPTHEPSILFCLGALNTTQVNS